MALRKGAVDNLKSSIEEAQATGSVRLFSIRHEFPTQWAQFKSTNNGSSSNAAGITLNFRVEHYPFWIKGFLQSVKRVNLFAQPGEKTKSTITVSNQLGKDSMVKDPSYGGLRVRKLSNIPVPSSPTDTLDLFFDDNSIENLWLALTWGGDSN